MILATLRFYDAAVYNALNFRVAAWGEQRLRIVKSRLRSRAFNYANVCIL
jgi:hypothetical protein